MADGIIKGGTSGNETIYGTAGNDFLYGNGGADILIGGDGDDRLDAGQIYDAATNTYKNDLIGDTFDGGNGNDEFWGSFGNDIMNGGNGNDAFHGGAGADIMNGGAGYNAYDGGDGVDTVVYNGPHSSFGVSVGADHVAHVTGNGISDTVLPNVERIVFNDAGVALDINGNAGKMFRLYQAAFDRAPDQVGLGFWIDAADRGEPWLGMAHGFTHSAEFDRLYGANANNDTFLTALYANALHRTPDADGYKFWIDALNRGVSRESVLIDFAESPENQAQVIGSIEHGINYVPWA